MFFAENYIAGRSLPIRGQKILIKGKYLILAVLFSQ